MTTVNTRLVDLLPRTLQSLAKAGFESPRLFIDGADHSVIPSSLHKYPITSHCPNLRTYGNWILSAWELYVREPHAERYAIFQDDFVTYPNLRQYLEQCDYPARGYWNLYTFPINERKEANGWYVAPHQRGLGAVALVFSNECLRKLLGSQYMADRPLDASRGWKSVDGGIVSALKGSRTEPGWQEWVHYPSLVQHTGINSSMGNKKQELALSFRGEDFDALSLVNKPLINPVESSTRPVIAQQVEDLLDPSSGVVITQESRRKFEKVALVGYNCASGLGELNRQIVTYGDISFWCIKPHRNFPTLPELNNPRTDCAVVHQGAPSKIKRIVDAVDVLLFCEQPFYLELVPMAKQAGKRVVCVPMLEWMTPGAKGWPESVDLFICPTEQCYKTFKDVVPCVHFPWPVDTNRFTFAPRKTCQRFLFIAGHGGYLGHKGVDVVKRAKEIWPEMPLVVRSQDQGAAKGWKNVETLPPTDSNADLYREGDVLVCPHCVDGLGLEPMEAMTCGMPVITTAGEPWNEIPAIGRIPATVSQRRVNRNVDWYSPDAQELVNICENLLGTDLEQPSLEARTWAEGRSWSKLSAEFVKLVRGPT